MTEHKIDMTYRDFNYDLAFKLRTMREKLDLTKVEASEKFGIEQAMIRGYESGKKTANMLYVHKLASECGLTLNDVLLDTKEFLAKLWF